MGNWTFHDKPWYRSWQPFVMLAFVVLESSFLFIQAAKTYQRKSAEDLSLTAFSIFLFTGISWILWGLYTHDVPVLVGGVIQSLGTLVILIAIFTYGQPGQPPPQNPVEGDQEILAVKENASKSTHHRSGRRTRRPHRKRSA